MPDDDKLTSLEKEHSARVAPMESVLCFLCVGLLIGIAHGTATFSDCGGAEKSMTIIAGSVKPDPIQYPGNLSMTVAFNVTKDLPASNFQMALNLTKLNPRVMHVPCMEDIGSCTYDVCTMIQNHRSEFCPMFPNPDECGCPIKVGSYFMKDGFVAIPDFGQLFVKILQGNYEGTITFTDTSSNTQHGCIAIKFEITPSTM
ncbi:uncharacterized protein CEXT_389401 [Caerostris extrusa]|uniref:MD-2-related lipid-recognition domain-containing protein n=1 Tax=Caerostris extrusa TaxID=172846 RepID=A0AAV4PND4_CAEEX|nr:uncharacterized protein CEXT_389401 [Caerostris extrusa]